MKNIFIKRISVLTMGLLLFAPACTDLTEELYSEATDENFFQTDEEFVAALGAAYSSLGVGNHGNLWSINEIASDELVIATKGGDWYDGGVLIELHDHTFTPDNGFFNNTWGLLYGGISTCNRLIYQFQILADGGNEDADAFIAELRAIRALWYYWALDAYGNVPLSIDFTVTTPVGNNSNFQAGRTEVYNYVLSELNAIIPLLSSEVGSSTYGRMNQSAAYALRAKLYLNAEVYTGTAQWANVVADVDMLTDYSLMSLYSDNFAIDNEGSSENIFVVPYDKVFAGGFNWPMMTFHYATQNTYNFTEQPWNGYGVVEEFYNSYIDPINNPGPQGPVWRGLAEHTDPTIPNGVGTLDSRLSNFIVGPQFNSDGTRTSDPAVEGPDSDDPDPDGAELNYTPQHNMIHPFGWRQAGARIGKYEYEKGGTADMSNDFVIFRYSDMMLAKAEALWRQNPSDAAALTIVNNIRTRAGVDPFPSLTADNLLAERGREMFAEMTRRQDLIRFANTGSALNWGSAWWAKPASGVNERVFPIPQVQMDANSSLTQNPGY